MIRALALLGLLFCAVSAHAADQTVAFNYTIAGKFDKSFSEAAHRGVINARAAGIAVAEISPDSEAEHGVALAQAAGRSEHVIAIGFAFSEDLARIAPDFPNRRFTIIDGVVPAGAENVRAIRFHEEESSFLVGALAARKSASGRVGFVGGMDNPVIRRFLAGYHAGARHVRPDIQVLWRMAGRTPAAFGDPYEGWLIASDQLDDGADVIYAAAGATGLGAYLAAAQRGAFAIGVDSNQNYLHPGAMLTSALKRVDRAVELALTSWRDGVWRPGETRLGLDEDGVGVSFDRHNEALLDDADRAFIEETRARILRGEIGIPTEFDG